MFCPNCGNQLPDGSNFCGGCGKVIGGVQPNRPSGIWECYTEFWKKYADFQTRTTRKEYWYFVLANIIAVIILQIIDTLLATIGICIPTYSGYYGILSSIYSLAALIPSFAIVWRRLHDINKSGVNYLWVLLPLIGWIILLVYFCKKGDEGPNRYGSL